MNLFEWNKIAAGVLGGLLLITAVRITADMLYRPHYIAVPEAQETAAPAAAAAPEKSLSELLQTASAKKGARVARKCMSCHTFTSGGPDRIGPNLWDIIGQKTAHRADFRYSSAMRQKQGVWDYESLAAFVENPRKAVPGTNMSFAGLRKAQQRADLLAYLRTLSPSPPALP